MIKYLLLGLIIYAYYRFFLAPKRIADRDQREINDPEKEDGEYIDYEEID